MTRTFITLELNASQQAFLATIIRQGRQILPDLRWVEPISIHLTLAFLGELDEQQLNRARSATYEAASRSHAFRYQLSGLGTFGSAQQARVLWMGVNEPTGALNAVQRTLSLALEKQAFLLEKRPFSPHLTLAHIKAPLTSEQAQLLQQLLSRSQFASPDYYVRELAVMKSALTASGAHYTCLTSCSMQ